MPRRSSRTSRASLVAALGLSVVPIAGVVMQYTGDSPAVVAQEEAAQSGAGNRSSGGFQRTVNAADTVTDAALVEAAQRAADAFAQAGPAVTEIVQVATSEAASDSSE